MLELVPVAHLGRSSAAPLGGEEGEEFAEGLAAVAVAVFFFAGDFRKGFMERWKVKDGIVAKAVLAARRCENFAISAIGDDCFRAAAKG